MNDVGQCRQDDPPQPPGFAERGRAGIATGGPCAPGGTGPAYVVRQRPLRRGDGNPPASAHLVLCERLNDSRNTRVDRLRDMENDGAHLVEATSAHAMIGR